MNIQEQIENIKQYQNCGCLHPLTCGNDSRHRVLKPVEKDGKVILVCLDCDYVQTWIPNVPVMSSLPRFGLMGNHEEEKSGR